MLAVAAVTATSPSVSAQTTINLSKDTSTIELENYGIEPVRLTEVRVER